MKQRVTKYLRIAPNSEPKVFAFGRPKLSQLLLLIAALIGVARSDVQLSNAESSSLNPDSNHRLLLDTMIWDIPMIDGTKIVGCKIVGFAADKLVVKQQQTNKSTWTISHIPYQNLSATVVKQLEEKFSPRPKTPFTADQLELQSFGNNSFITSVSFDRTQWRRQ